MYVCRYSLLYIYFSLKKSTMLQLQTLVEYMGENPEFARGTPVFGCSRMSLEEQWVKIVRKLNAMGPPSRTVVEWKKVSSFTFVYFVYFLFVYLLQTWADLKSRTKKKIAENQKSMVETGGGLYRAQHLTDLEKIIDRTLFISKAAAPSGKVFGCEQTKVAESVDSYFQILVDTPPRAAKTVAVITPTRQNQHSHTHTWESQVHQQQRSQKPLAPENQPHTFQQSHCSQLPQTHTAHTQPQQRSQHEQRKRRNDEEMPAHSSTKKKKVVDEQISLIRHQIKVSEEAASTAREQVNATKMLAEAAMRMADAAETQAEAAKKSANAAAAQTEIFKNIVYLMTNVLKQNEK